MSLFEGITPLTINIILFQNIVKNLERQEVRDWLQNTKDILNEEKKVRSKFFDIFI